MIKKLWRAWKIARIKAKLSSLWMSVEIFEIPYNIAAPRILDLERQLEELENE